VCARARARLVGNCALYIWTWTGTVAARRNISPYSYSNVTVDCDVCSW